MLVYRVEDTPRAYLDLAWNAFFASRGRGVSMDAHFPWLKGGGRDDRSFCIAVDGQPAAMLVLRRGMIEHAGQAWDFYAIGLVCTAPAYQKRGLASRVMGAALDAVEAGAPVLLWTSRRDYYARFGFEPIDPTLVVSCHFPADHPTTGSERADWRPGTEPSPLFGGMRGLPSFTEGAYQLRLAATDKVSFIISAGPKPALLSMTAPPLVAAEALASLGFEELLLNLPRSSLLLDALRAHGARMKVRATGIAMWRPGRCNRAKIAQWDIPLLDRF